MKLFALSILGLALAVPAARAQNQDTNDSSKATAQQGTDATKSTAQQGTDATKSTAQQGTDTTKSTAQTSDTGKATAMDKKAKDRPAAARSHDLGKSDDECMCDCNGKMIKGKKSHPMGRGPATMDRSRPSSASDASRASSPASPNAPAADTSAGAGTDTSSQPSKGAGDMNPSSPDNKTENPSNPR